LYNHRHIHGLLRDEFERCGRTGASLTAAMFDLDLFKSVNDTYGHPAGDRVLVQIAGIMRVSARDIDRLGRYGGEEFIALLPATDAVGGAVFVERVRLAVENHEFHIGAGEPIGMTISAGVATYPHHQIGDAEALIHGADRALYAAKAGGRNRTIRFDQMENAEATE
jgi:diguanylate cyclase (GGDEF)-like protein